MSIAAFACLALWAGVASPPNRGVTAEQGGIRGRVVDATGRGLPNAVVRVRQTASGSPVTVARVIANREGKFEVNSLSAGTYSVRASLGGGFRPRVVKAIPVRAAHVEDIGDVGLELNSCDAPETACDDFGLRPGAWEGVISRGALALRVGCGLELDTARVRCAPDETRTPGTGTGVGLSLVRGPDGLHAVPALQVGISELNPSTADCSNVKYGSTPIRVDGLGRGDSFCVRSASGLRLHVFVLESEIAVDMREVGIWHVTRKP